MVSPLVTLWEKLLFWKKPKKPKLDTDYEFYLIDESDYTGIRLLKGDYSGVTYYYGTVSFEELSDFLNLKFEYKVMDSGNYTEEHLHSDSKFVKIIGDILREIILTEEAKYESYRKDNFTQFDL
jgi:hypothetical protein